MDKNPPDLTFKAWFTVYSGIWTTFFVAFEIKRQIGINILSTEHMIAVIEQLNSQDTTNILNKPFEWKQSVTYQHHSWIWTSLPLRPTLTPIKYLFLSLIPGFFKSNLNSL